jgi:hypothetical protein
MSKFIIENRTELNDLDVFKRISSVVNLGLISDNDSVYCYATSFDDCVVTFRETEYGYKIHVLENRIKKEEVWEVLKEES